MTFTYYFNIDNSQDIHIIGSKPRKNSIHGSCFYLNNQILSLRPNKKIFIYDCNQGVVLQTIKYLVETDDIPDFQYLYLDQEQNLYSITQQDSIIFINQIDLQARILNKIQLQGQLLSIQQDGIYYLQQNQIYLFGKKIQQTQKIQQQQEIQQQIQQQDNIKPEQIENQVEQQQQQQQEQQQEIQEEKITQNIDEITDIQFDFIEDQQLINEQSKFYETMPIQDQQLPLNVTPLNILFQQQIDDQLYDQSELSIACKEVNKQIMILSQHNVFPNDNISYFQQLQAPEVTKLYLYQFYQEVINNCKQIMAYSSVKDSLYEKAISLIKSYISYCFTTLSVFQQIQIQAQPISQQQQTTTKQLFQNKLTIFDQQSQQQIHEIISNAQDLIQPQVLYFLAFIFNDSSIIQDIKITTQDKNLNGKIISVIHQPLDLQQFTDEQYNNLLINYITNQNSEEYRNFINLTQKIKESLTSTTKGKYSQQQAQSYTDYYLQSYLVQNQSTENWNILALHISDNFLLKYSILLEIYCKQQNQEIKQMLKDYLTSKENTQLLASKLHQNQEPILTNALQGNIIEDSVIQLLFTNLVSQQMYPQITECLIKFNNYWDAMEILKSQNIPQETALKAFKLFISHNQSEKILNDFIEAKIINQNNLKEFILIAKQYINQQKLTEIIKSCFVIDVVIFKFLFQ